MNTDIQNYLRRQSTKPLMRIHYRDHHVSGRIYCIGTPKVINYKFTTSHKGFGGRSYSVPVIKEAYTDPEVVEQYKKKGWTWSWITAYNGYEIDCLTKEGNFEGLPKGDNLVGYGWEAGLLIGRDAIEEYLSDNFRGFDSITIYRVPANLL